MSATLLIKRTAASAFAVTALSVELILRTAGAALAALVSLGLVGSFWTEK